MNFNLGNESEILTITDRYVEILLLLLTKFQAPWQIFQACHLTNYQPWYFCQVLFGFSYLKKLILVILTFKNFFFQNSLNPFKANGTSFKSQAFPFPFTKLRWIIFLYFFSPIWPKYCSLDFATVDACFLRGNSNKASCTKN